MANISKGQRENPPYRDDAGVLRKFCNVCEVFKPATHFHRNQSRCKDCNNKASYESRARNPERTKEMFMHGHRLRKYGLTKHDYEKLLAFQKGRCAICNRLPLEVSTRENLVVDHDHETNKVRGLLCHVCNAAIGLLQDRIDILLAAADYLEDNK